MPKPEEILESVACGEAEIDTHELARLLLELPPAKVRRPEDAREAWSEEIAGACLQVAVWAW